MAGYILPCFLKWSEHSINLMLYIAALSGVLHTFMAEKLECEQAPNLPEICLMSSL